MSMILHIFATYVDYTVDYAILVHQILVPGVVTCELTSMASRLMLMVCQALSPMN